MENSHEQKQEQKQEQETLIFNSYPCAYYVQSPSTVSHANSTTDIRNIAATTADFSAFHSPVRSDTNTTTRLITLSRYSSRGSNHSFLNHDDKNIIHSETENRENRLIIVDHHGGCGGGGRAGYEEEGEEEETESVFYYGIRKKRGCWWKYFSFRDSSSCLWVSLQIIWRLVVSLGIALLVFYIATKPPSPKISVKIGGIREFGIGEGVDAYGVATNILTCNGSVDLLIDNKSKLYGLHIQPPIIEMSFGRLPFAISHGPKLYAMSHSTTLFQLYVGTRNKPMYGAGRNMQDMLKSGKGLPLTIRMSLRSNYRVVWSLVNPKIERLAECSLVLDRAYDKKHRTQAYNSSCKILS